MRALAATAAVLLLLLMLGAVIDRVRLAAARTTPLTKGTVTYVSSEDEQHLDDSPQCNIYASRPDGTAVRQVTHTENEFGASFAPNGFDYAYGGTTLHGAKNLYLRELWSDEEPETLLEEQGVNNEYPAWSPDGRTIAFQSSQGGKTRIRLLDASTHVPRELEGQPAGFDCEDPAWSPDGEWLAFSANSETDSEIVVMRLSTGETRTFVDDRNRRMRWPAFRPKSNQMSFVVRDDETGKGAVYTILPGDPDASWERLNTIHTSVARPAWSGKGDRLAYLGTEDGQAHLFVVDPDGSRLQRITDYVAASPEWRPTQDDILYGAHWEGGYELTLYDTRESQVTRLTHNSGSFDVPQLSPDGEAVAAGRWRWRRFDETWHYQVVLLVDGDCASLEIPDPDLVETFNPSWNADGTQLCFDGKTRASGRWNSFAVGWPQTTDSRALSRGIESESLAQPDWLSGTAIVARLTKGGATEVGILSVAKDGGLATVDRTLGPGESPDSDPRGSMVAFASDRDGYKDEAGHDLPQVYLVSAGSRGKPYPLTSADGRTAYSYPRWAPDRNALVVQATRWNPDGSKRNEIRILKVVRLLLWGRYALAKDYVLAVGESPSWSAAPECRADRTEIDQSQQ